MESEVIAAGLKGPDQRLAFPVITKSGINQQGKMVHYYFNYSATPTSFKYPHNNGKELMQRKTTANNSQAELAAWDVKIVVEN